MFTHKLKFTKLENKILEILFRYPTTVFRGKELANLTNSSLAGVLKSIKGLEKEELIIVKKDFILSISLNRENEDVFFLKRINNLSEIYESGLLKFMNQNFKGSTIILFGSYSLGEDIEKSDIDLAVIGTKEKNIELEKYEKTLKRPIRIQYFNNLEDIDKNLKENLINGFVLKGAIEL